MDLLTQKLISFSDHPMPILDRRIPLEEYVSLDLSINNPYLKGMDITNPDTCQSYIETVLNKKQGKVAYGGYLEKRGLYSDKANFSGSSGTQRNVHLGIDYWCRACTAVISPLDGVVHSFKNNHTIGDYGPTLILQHELDGDIFYTLYGHLSIDSLDDLFIGKKFKAGELLASLGTPDINVNYAPHLHFQLIKDIQGYFGDYPGVCSLETLDFYRKNCPDPNFLLKIG